MRLYSVTTSYSTWESMYRLIAAETLEHAQQLHTADPVYAPETGIVESEHWTDLGPIPETGRIVSEEYNDG